MTVNDLDLKECKNSLVLGTKLDELRNSLKISFIFICIFLSTCGAEYFRGKIVERWRNVRLEHSTEEQSWLIPHPTRSAWSASREFHKVSLVKHIVGYKPRINNQNDTKCMDTFLKQVPESDLVMTNLGPDKDYLPVQTPLLDYLTVEIKGSTGWMYPKLQELRRFQQKRGLTYSVLEDVEVREVICGISSTEEIQKFHEWITKKTSRKSRQV